MKIKIISVGKIKDREIKLKINDYTERIKHDAAIELYTVKDSDKKTEGKKIIEQIKKDVSYTVALSEEGNEYTSREFSGKILQKHANMLFIIGGPFGLDRVVKEKADIIFSLSKMTFPHEMAQLFLLEQIYRGISINLNRKYHKD
jgi:23S rRNA (pseudouridine1915-N3)-methyltransferase